MGVEGWSAFRAAVSADFGSVTLAVGTPGETPGELAAGDACATAALAGGNPCATLSASRRLKRSMM